MNDVQHWATDELGNADLGDLRLSRRLALIAAAVASNPTASIPATFERWTDTKACYNFFASRKVTPAKIRMPHQQRTRERMAEQPVTLVALDISGLDFTARTSVEGLGYLDAPHMRGVLVQTALAVTPEGQPLGVLDQQTWIRPLEQYRKRTRAEKAQHVATRPTAQKQTQRWIDALESIRQQTEALAGTTIVVADREADIYEVIARPLRSNLHLLIRAYHKRALDGIHGGVRTALERQAVLGEYDVEVARGAERPGRTARVAIRAMSATLARPKGLSAETAERVTVQLVDVREIAPKPGEPAVHWTLLTSLPVETLEDAQRIAGYYSRRWLVERFHYTLKSGCSIEKLELESRERIENALAVYSVVAWRLMDLLYHSRVRPEAHAAEAFDEHQLAVLRIVATRQQPTRQRGTNRRIAQAPIAELTLAQAVLTIARMGGFLARAGDGNPGIKTLWRGLSKLDDMVEGLRLAQQIPRLNGNA